MRTTGPASTGEHRNTNAETLSAAGTLSAYADQLQQPHRCRAELLIAAGFHGTTDQLDQLLSALAAHSHQFTYTYMTLLVNRHQTQREHTTCPTRPALEHPPV